MLGGIRRIYKFKVKIMEIEFNREPNRGSRPPRRPVKRRKKKSAVRAKKQKEADAIISKEKGIEVDCSHHHHTVFNWHDFAVENHYDFINVYHHKSHAKLERILSPTSPLFSGWN